MLKLTLCGGCRSEREPRSKKKGGTMRYWSKREDLILCRLYPDHPRKELAAKLHRSDDSIKSRAEKLGIRKRFGCKPWTAADHAQFRKIYPHLPCAEVAGLLGQKASTVNSDGNERILCVCGQPSWI